MAASLRAKAMTGFMKVGSLRTVVDAFEDEADDFLNDFVACGRHPQSTLPHHPHEFRDG
jgi:hypothetical protein